MNHRSMTAFFAFLTLATACGKLLSADESKDMRRGFYKDFNDPGKSGKAPPCKLHPVSEDLTEGLLDCTPMPLEEAKTALDTPVTCLSFSSMGIKKIVVRANNGDAAFLIAGTRCTAAPKS